MFEIFFYEDNLSDGDFLFFFWIGDKRKKQILQFKIFVRKFVLE